MDVEDPFLLQLARAIQAWLWIEGELYSMYQMLMQGANSHLVSATFNSIQSVDAKLALLNSCFSLVFARGSIELQQWRALLRTIEKLNKKRNKIVHEPVSIHYGTGAPTVLLGPSHSNSLALVKGQTTHQGSAVVSAAYSPSDVHILNDHTFTELDVAVLEQSFKTTAITMREYQDGVRTQVAAAIHSAEAKRQK